MPHDEQLTSEHLAQFERDGLLRIDRLLSARGIERARQAMLRPLEALGLLRDGAWQLDGRPMPVWPATGLKTARDIGHRHPEVEALIEEPRLRAIVDALLGHRPIDREVYPRPQLLVSLPNAGRWVLPGGWHTDLPRLASGESPGVQLFTFLEPVGARGGGTLAVAGSHRLLNDGRSLKIREINAALGQHDYFRHLCRERAADSGGQDLPTGCVGDVQLRVIELAGGPGDVWLMDLRTLHCASPNASDRPRMMMTYRFVPAELMPEIAAAFGWV